MKESKISFSSDMTVKLVRSLASDDSVVQSAQVSVIGENKPGTDPTRLINWLMKSRHGSPFEHNSFTFFVEAPIFVIREWQRHRISSFNEMSGRYTKLQPKFYIPDNRRKLINVGSSARPKFEDGSEYQNRITNDLITKHSEESWSRYEELINLGIGNEVARTVLPLNIYTQMYWTVNARSLMNFLSLRVSDISSKYETNPQYEIQVAAEKVELFFKDVMPITHNAFCEYGRVAP